MDSKEKAKDNPKITITVRRVSPLNPYLDRLAKIKTLNLNSSMRHNAAVSLYVFTLLGSTDVNTKRILRLNVFQKGGFDCEYKKSPHYKTVNRQINTFSKLAKAMVIAKIKQEIDLHSPEIAIQKIDSLLAADGLDTLDAMSDYYGGSSNKSRRLQRALDYASTYATSCKDTDAGHLIQSGTLSVLIPNEIDIDNIKQLIRQLSDYYESRILLEDTI